MVSEAPKESAIVKLLVTPVTFISFLISLFLIDSHNNSLRFHQHSSSYRPPKTLYGRSKAFIHNLVFKPQPYTYIRSPYREPPPGREERREDEPWHWHTKQRKMMKMEVSDAFEVRHTVLAGMLVTVCGMTWLTLYLGNCMWQMWY
ncbi:ATP phosphoribosyltransferase protein [Rutstroemia sp. NJR-2017a BBW]|nr:ATP phosphoribosyltransferase protein [Rutstroemia sp. NJR-2017a BBW]